MRGMKQQRREKYIWTSSVGEDAVQSCNIFTIDAADFFFNQTRSDCGQTNQDYFSEFDFVNIKF